MQRTARISVAVLALLLLVAGTAFATRSTWGDSHRSPMAATSHQPGQPDSSDEASESPEAEPSESEDAHASPEANDAGAQLTDDHAAALVALLKAAGIDATADQLKTLAAKYGVGGAVRLLAWADASGKTVDQIAAMFNGGMGWGEIAHQLETGNSSLHLSPGIGWIMGHGHGHGQGHGKPS